MKNPQISIIIRTYNEQKMIGQCLESVFNQKINLPFEVIIVDSESEDKTLEIASKFPVRIIKIRKKDFTYGRALNIGCKNAQGKYLIFLSAHAIPVDESWMENLISNFDNPRIAGVYGKEVPVKKCDHLTKRLMQSHWGNIQKVQSKTYFFSNVNALIRKKIWLKIKFNEKLICSEDHEWSKRVQKNGYLTSYEPRAVVAHSHNYNFRQTFSRYYKEIYSELFVYDKKFISHINNSIYCFYYDIKYVLQNKRSPYWIIRSLVNNVLFVMATLFAFSRKLLWK